MILYKLIGYEPLTDVYTNPQSGLVEYLPSMPFVVADTIPPTNYMLYDAPENWASQGQNLIGSYTGLEEYLSLRVQIYTRIENICGTDYSNWNSLSDSQKQIALVWCNLRMADVVGLPTYAQYCGSLNIAKRYINDFINYSIPARQLRYDTFSLFGFTYLGNAQGIKAEHYARKDFLDSIFLNRGVVLNSEDGVDGLGDWVLGQNSYTTTGLKPMIVSGQFILNGIDVDTFCNALIGIIHDGIF